MRANHYHFIGIGGIGMSALARILLEKKNAVSGSDLKETATTQQLKELGALIYEGHQPHHIVEGAHVIYSTDIPKTNPEWEEAQRLRLKISHRSEFLDELMKDKKPLLVTGCHGKTSTTALLATLLLEGGLDPSFVVGGYVRSMMTNGRHGQGDYFVAEADESDGSFLKTPGWGAIVTNADEDHISYWKTKENLLKAYQAFIAQTQNKELLFLCAEDPFLRSLEVKAQYYGFSEQCHLRITRIQQEGFFSDFDLSFKGHSYTHFKMKMQGVHQVLNATAAIGMALQLGVSIESIKKTLLHYEGVKRRLEPIGEVNTIKIFDDYAHHPAEIKTTLDALKKAVQQGRLIVVFQPHRYTRLHRHLLEFACVFDLADLCIMTELYGAGEPPIPGITTEALLEKMTHPHATFVPLAELVSVLSSLVQPFDTIVTLGAGDITHYGPKLLMELKKRI